jgi:hypothetical protein
MFLLKRQPLNDYRKFLVFFEHHLANYAQDSLEHTMAFRRKMANKYKKVPLERQQGENWGFFYLENWHRSAKIIHHIFS